MTANLENIHKIYNIFCQKNRMNADIINLFDHFHLSQRLRHLKMEKQQGISVSLLIVLCASSECAMRVSEVSTRTSSTDWSEGHRSSRAREFHPHPLTEPCVKVSPHTAIEITIDKKTLFFITT